MINELQKAAKTLLLF